LRTPRLACVAAAVGLLSCATLSVDEERRLGSELAREVRAELVLVRDREVVRYVERIGHSIVRAAGPQPFEYHFYVVDDEEINAFAMPAGHIYIHTGTVLKARDVSELAGVIAHEVGHVARRHIAQNYERHQAAGLLHRAGVVAAGVTLGSSGAGAANLLGGLSAMAVLNSFGREAEREADSFAVDVLPRAGYAPGGLVRFFHTLQHESGPRPPAFLSSHPAPAERIERTRREVAALPPTPGLRRTDGGQLEIIQRRIELLARRSQPVPTERVAPGGRGGAR
jgi:beta-barrel assembly-enhancing protease